MQMAAGWAEPRPFTDAAMAAQPSRNEVTGSSVVDKIGATMAAQSGGPAVTASIVVDKAEGAMATQLSRNEAAESSGANKTGLHWSRHLKCQVCFGYLKQPHTLNCGHSFCRICLIKIGQTARAANPDFSRRYYRLPCPTCRALFPACTVMRTHPSTTFLVQNLVSDWKKERKRLQRNSSVTMRSICTQTANRTYRLRRRKSTSVVDLDMHEEYHVRLRCDDLYLRAMTANSSDSSEDIDAAGGGGAKPPQQSIESRPDPSANSSETSTASSLSSVQDFVFGRRFEDFGHRFGVGHGHDLSAGRVLLMSVWCMYSMVVVGIVQPMLPYMVLITFFFLLLILK